MYLSNSKGRHTYIIEHFEHQDHENNDVEIHYAVMPIKKAYRKTTDDDVRDTSLNIEYTSSGKKSSSFDTSIKTESNSTKEPNHENKLKTCSYQWKIYLGKLDVLCPNPKHKQHDHIKLVNALMLTLTVSNHLLANVLKIKRI
jgi:hypothetical protein